MNGKLWIALGMLLAAAAVGMGAYHAHGLEKMLTARGLEPKIVARRVHDCEVGVRYQFFHALGLVVLPVVLSGAHRRLRGLAPILMLAGTVLFSGGLYVIVFAGTPIHWAIVPFGGLLMIGSWIIAAVAVLAGRHVGVSDAAE